MWKLWSRLTGGTPSSDIPSILCIPLCSLCPMETSTSTVSAQKPRLTCKIASVIKSVKSLLCLPVQKEKGYTSLQDEAVKIFNSLQEMEAVSDPVPIIQGILQTCQDLRSLRDEVYCQLIKQTNHVPHPNSPANRAHWHLLTCMSCTFLPSRAILRYLRFHLKRCTVLSGLLNLLSQRNPHIIACGGFLVHFFFCSWCLFRIRELFPGTEIEMFAHFISESLKKTKAREFVPSQEEIVALLTRQEMTTTVYCHGGGSCKISINSHTTAGEVCLRGTI